MIASSLFPAIIERLIDSSPMVACSVLSPHLLVVPVALHYLFLAGLKLFITVLPQRFISLNHERLWRRLKAAGLIIALSDIAGRLLLNHGSICYPKLAVVLSQTFLGIEINEKAFGNEDGVFFENTLPTPLLCFLLSCFISLIASLIILVKKGCSKQQSYPIALKSLSDTIDELVQNSAPAQLAVQPGKDDAQALDDEIKRTIVIGTNRQSEITGKSCPLPYNRTHVEQRDNQPKDHQKAVTCIWVQEANAKLVDEGEQGIIMLQKARKPQVVKVTTVEIHAEESSVQGAQGTSEQGQTLQETSVKASPLQADRFRAAPKKASELAQALHETREQGLPKQEKSVNATPMQNAIVPSSPLQETSDQAQACHETSFQSQPLHETVVARASIQSKDRRLQASLQTQTTFQGTSGLLLGGQGQAVVEETTANTNSIQTIIQPSTSATTLDNQELSTTTEAKGKAGESNQAPPGKKILRVVSLAAFVSGISLAFTAIGFNISDTRSNVTLNRLLQKCILLIIELIPVYWMQSIPEARNLMMRRLKALITG